MSSLQPVARAVNVVELNPHAPRPFAFTEVAHCLRDSIRAAGFESDLYVNRTDSSAISLIVGAVPPHLEPIAQLDPGKTIIFNFEQLASDSSVTSSEYKEWLRNWLVADYHSSNVAYLQREYPAQQVVEFPVVPGPSLAFRPELAAEKSVDVLFFGSPSERRTEIVRRLTAAGISVETVAGAYADELTPAVRRARIVLHVHFYETGLFPVARILQPVVDGVPIVCEVSAFSARSDWSRSGIVFAPYDGIVAACQALLCSPGEQLERAARTRLFASQLDFATPLNQALQALTALSASATPPRVQAPQPLQPPQLIQAPRPLQPPQQSAPTEEPGDGELLSDGEIEAILASEADQLPPESHVSAAPLKMAERQPGKGPYGVWIVVLLLVFSFYTIWLSMGR